MLLKCISISLHYRLQIICRWSPKFCWLKSHNFYNAVLPCWAFMTQMPTASPWIHLCRNLQLGTVQVEHLDKSSWFRGLTMSSRWLVIGLKFWLETMGFTSKNKGFSAYCPVNQVWDYCKTCQPSLLTLPILNGCRHPESNSVTSPSNGGSPRIGERSQTDAHCCSIRMGKRPWAHEHQLFDVAGYCFASIHAMSWNTQKNLTCWTGKPSPNCTEKTVVTI
jgi:hypothetical protein